MLNGSFALGLLLGAVVGPVLIFAFAFRLVRRRVKNEAYEPPWIPNDALVTLDWEVQTLDGKNINLGKQVASQVVFLNFWATWCLPCIGEADSIDRLYERFKGRVSFACISQENPVRIRRFRKKTGYQFPMYHLGSKPPSAFQAQGVPATFIISKTRQVVLRHVGAADWAHENVVHLLDKLLSDDAPLNVGDDQADTV